MAVENVSDICDRVMTSTKVLLLELVNSVSDQTIANII